MAMSTEMPYWTKQAAGKPLYADIEWNKPERRNQAGKLLILGGNKLGFMAAAESYQTAKDTGAGHVKVLLPDCLKSVVPRTLEDVIFAPCTNSGSLAMAAKPELTTAAAWSDAVLLIGDTSRNSETTILYEQFLQEYVGPLTITRDAIDLFKATPTLLVDRPDTLIVASFSQLQKLFQGIYYPKMLTFSMQLLQAVEALHKFTTTYPCTIVTLHNDTIIIASSGDVTTQAWDNPMAIWRGSVATRAACYWLWNPSNPSKATVASIA